MPKTCLIKIARPNLLLIAALMVFAAISPQAAVLINEADVDQGDTDAAEFIELYGNPYESLDGLVLVLYDGLHNVVYRAYDLSGYSCDSGGFFVICGDVNNCPDCDLDVFPDLDFIQDGSDALALYSGDITDYSNGTIVVAANLVDALVYDTSDPYDVDLLAVLTPGQPQINENANGNSIANSMQRSPDGAGGARVTTQYIVQIPTPGSSNGSAHLLFTKAVIMTLASPQIGSEYVAISNPTSGTVDLSRYYLTDATSIDASYWEIVEGGGLGGGGGSGSFNARFPDGATLGPDETLVVSFAGSSEYQSVYGAYPDYELFEDGIVLDNVPELVEARPGGIAYGIGNPVGNQLPSVGWLDESETLVLYYWDGIFDLIRDIDYLTWGTSASRVDKSTVAVDGPDADTVATAYMPDTAAGSQIPMTVHEVNEANERINPEEGVETVTGGNGLHGHDETSENLSLTWGITSDLSPPVGGTPTLPVPIVTNASIETMPQYADEAVTIVVTTLSPSMNPLDYIFIYWRADGGAWLGVNALPLGGETFRATIPGQSPNTVVDWWVYAPGEESGADTWPSAAPFYYESYTVLPPVVPDDWPAHLLLTEVCVSGADHEFIEIYNPTDGAVELGDYYLTDAVFSDQGYWRLPEGDPSQQTVGGGEFFDFQSRFPADAVIEPGQALTVSLAGSAAYFGAWGVDPDFEMCEDGGSADMIPDMREVFAGSTQNADGTFATLTNSAEIVVLYYWDGYSDLVTDIDMFFWGASTTARVDRTGYTIGTSTYADDTPIPSQDAFTAWHEVGGSFQRHYNNEPGEPVSNGNGPAGHDETGEPLNNTWLTAIGTPGYPDETMDWMPSIEDHPNDQGYELDISWRRHDDDLTGAYPQVTAYDLQTYTGQWESVEFISASQQDTYEVSVMTTNVHVVGQPEVFSYYRLLAHTEDPLVMYTSPPDSGYSVDDIPPPTPILTITEGPDFRLLLWTPSEGVPDVDLTCLYRGTTWGFIPGSPFECIDGSHYVAPRWPRYFYVTQYVDIHGNIGPCSNEVPDYSPTDITYIGATCLQAIYPNPFNPSTTIDYSVGKEGKATIAIYDLKGKVVATLVDRILPSGNYSISWDGCSADGQSLAAGIYFCRLSIGATIETRRMALVR